jgi:hypothetical protein
VFLAAIIVIGVLALFFGIGLYGIRADQHKDDPLDKESNFWW